MGVVKSPPATPDKPSDRASRFVSDLSKMKVDRSKSTGRVFDLKRPSSAS